MKNSYTNPYNNYKSSDSKGIQHGSGLPAKYGKRKGTFTEDYQRHYKALDAAPPRKMN